MTFDPQARYAEWIASGKSTRFLLPDLTAALAKLWLSKHDVSPELAAFIRESAEGKDVWDRREICRACHETYRLENMATCIDCLTSYCWRCNAVRFQNRCACGGEMY